MGWPHRDVILLVLLGLMGVTHAQNPSFSCEGRPSGYYADVNTGCQVYHMCDGLGRQFSYTCPNATLFQQRMLICDHWYMVNCSKSEHDFQANLLIGQRDKPFVEDNRDHPYHRTPRPDLLTNSDNPEYNLIYRIQSQNNFNVVGVENDEKSGRGTDQPAYSPPSHWSTEHASRGGASFTSPKTTKNDQNVIPIDSTKKPYVTFKPIKIKFESPIIPAKSTIIRQEVAPVRRNDFVNFESSFKATTPVFPREVPPSLPTILQDFPEASPVSVNFQSNYKATTPVFPVEAPITQPDLIDDIVTSKPVVNFESSYKATTPVYPNIAPSTPKDNLAESDAPLNDFNPPVDSNSKLVVNFESKFKATTPVYPINAPSTPTDNLSESDAPLNNISSAPIQVSNKPVVNFESRFKATTPVFPEEAPTTLPTFLETVNSNFGSKINFESKYKATTPVFPQEAPVTSSFDLVEPAHKVLFKSNYVATTPVFPQQAPSTAPLVEQFDGASVELDRELQPPKVDSQSAKQLLGTFPHNPFLSGLGVKRDPNDGSAFVGNRNGFQDLKISDVQFHFDSEMPLNPTNLFLQQPETVKVARAPQINWKELKKKFFIPEYEFPLENLALENQAGRPGYDGQISSFNVTRS